MSQYCPPPVLVKTWLLLINLSAEDEAIAHAKRMINRNFGSVDLAITYIEQNQQKPVKSPLIC
jgi:protein-tyrosine phosphatase